MPNAIISDTSCFIVLNKIEELDLLRQVYGQVITTAEIAEEYGEDLPDWVHIVTVADRKRQAILQVELDIGESSAIVLAMEIEDSTVILDDYKARKIASLLGIRFTGTIGVIIRAKLNGLIPSIKPILEKIKQTDFRLSESVELAALKAANE